jgi:hypothetical protein
VARGPPRREASSGEAAFANVLAIELPDVDR